LAKNGFNLVGFRKEKNIFLCQKKHANSAQISPLLKQNNYEQAEAEFTLGKLVVFTLWRKLL
jgi:hypothetical protein